MNDAQMFFCGFFIGFILMFVIAFVVVDQRIIPGHKTVFYKEAQEAGVGSFVIIDPATGKSEWRWTRKIETPSIKK